MEDELYKSHIGTQFDATKLKADRLIGKGNKILTISLWFN